MKPSGVVLYYKYINLSSEEQGSVANFFQNTCDSLGLRGRVRVAQDGINVVLAGSLEALEQHCQLIRDHPKLQGSDIDFKLSEDSHEQHDQRATEETGFDHLTVRQCKELVTLGALAEGRADPLKNTAPHLTPAQFHEELQRAAHTQSSNSTTTVDGNSSSPQSTSDTDRKEVVLLDARNAYETTIGHFKAEGVDLFDPHTRCFSDLPAWIDRHAPQLANRRILMYCTGGVRCERASAYLREKGPEFQDVAQLQGGIQRYLEAFPDGGYFKGKLLVYDHRVAVPPPSAGTPGGAGQGGELQEAAAVVGRCLVCTCPWDEYQARMRCSYCRQLVLVCDSCAQQHTSESLPSPTRQALLCQLCHQRGQASPAKEHHSSKRSVTNTGGRAASNTAGNCRGVYTPHTEEGGEATGNMAPGDQQGACQSSASGQEPTSAGSVHTRRVRILCLHGFRQTASSFEGRTHALRKKLCDLADFVFIDAPHTLPFFVKPKHPLPSAPGPDTEVEPAPGEAMTSSVQAQQEQTALLMPEQQQQLDSACVQAAGHPGTFQGQGPNLAGQTHYDHTLQGAAMAQTDWLAELGPPPPEKARKRAWLLSPVLLEMQRQRQQHQQRADSDAAGSKGVSASCIQGDRHCDTSQHPSLFDQPTRWEVAPDWVAAQQHLHQTQGCQETEAVLQHALSELGPFDGVLGFSQGAAMAAVLCATQRQKQQQGAGAALRFAILASGYPSPCPAHQQLAQATGPIVLPSLHLFGGEEGSDAQIGSQESEALSRWFSAPICVRHGSAHIIPATRTHVAAIRSFLQQFLEPSEPP